MNESNRDDMNGKEGENEKVISRRALLGTIGTLGVAAAMGGMIFNTRFPSHTASASGATTTTTATTDHVCTTTGVINMAEYGASGDGSDVTLLIQSAIDDLESAGGGVIYFPKGTYGISATLAISKAISLYGDGTAGDNLDATGGDPLHMPVSVIKWVGSAGTQNMIKYSPGTDYSSPNQIRGARIQNIALDGDFKAAIGLYLERFCMGSVDHIRIMRTTQTSLRLWTTSTFPHDNVMFNLFQNVILERSPNCLTIGSDTAGSNVCHNTFINFVIDHNGSDGFVLGESDNNTFINFYCINRQYPSHYSLVVKGTDAQLVPTSNWFYHFQGSTLVKAGNEGTGFIGYDKSNGQPDPVIEAGAKVLMFQIGTNASHHLLNNVPMRRLGVKLDGTAVVTNNGLPEESNFKIDADYGHMMSITLDNSTRMGGFHHNPDGSGFVQWAQFNNRGFDWVKIGNKKIGNGVGAPASGSWAQGDRILNTAPSEQGTAGSKYIIDGWVCVASGTPGTWVEQRTLTGN
ncbi:glycosyl hydrolase family 28-related protein [Paenibacillus sp. GCM10027626]|uniref:glycosyl hydrolase family 28-related protein n=1 Tax=Paenibacillus sp. GCM10027626 TaxID=3273411 RepID=UPI003638F1B6